MRKRELKRRLKVLEDRVEWLEGRPQVWVYPNTYPQPIWVQPQVPYLTWCGNDVSASTPTVGAGGPVSNYTIEALPYEHH